ncbi:hypothetical protein [Salinimicrobium xinjiangense]|uniref:hypothetical protein n=1 Tax=Salinimicrobium xinjiangense TaxID=438596 RepID=UPI00041E4B56|nr:hypothetical protein [Salinimicrobium xinjiangense]
MIRYIFAILTMLVMFTACGGDSASEEVDSTPVVAKDSIPTLEGEFIFLSDAAVLKGKNYIYGVRIDSTSKKLADSIEPMKRDEFHMIPVVVKGEIIKNPGRDGWEELVIIKEVLEISPDIPERSVPKVTKD